MSDVTAVTGPVTPETLKLMTSGVPYCPDAVLSGIAPTPVPAVVTGAPHGVAVAVAVGVTVGVAVTVGVGVTPVVIVKFVSEISKKTFPAP